MALIVHSVALEMVGAIRPLVGRIRARDRSLADQLSRAASSVVLNISEAEYSDPGNRRARFHTAAGSNREARAALQLAAAWGYIATGDTLSAERLADRVQAMLWRLAH